MSAPIASRVVPCPSCARPVVIPPDLEGSVVACPACRKPFRTAPAFPQSAPPALTPAGRIDGAIAFARGHRAVLGIAVVVPALCVLLLCAGLLAMRRGAWTEAELRQAVVGMSPGELRWKLGNPDQVSVGGGMSQINPGERQADAMWVYRGIIREKGGSAHDAVIRLDGGRVTFVMTGARSP